MNNNRRQANRQGNQPNPPNQPGISIDVQLLNACSKHSFDIDQIQELLHQGANINARDRFGNTPLHLAAFTQGTRQEELIQFLFDAGANYKAKSLDGSTAFELATGNNSANRIFLRALVDQAEWEKEQRQGALFENLVGILGRQERMIERMQRQIDHLNSQQSVEFRQEAGSPLSMFNASSGAPGGPLSSATSKYAEREIDEDIKAESDIKEGESSQLGSAKANVGTDENLQNKSWVPGKKL